MLFSPLNRAEIPRLSPRRQPPPPPDPKIDTSPTDPATRKMGILNITNACAHLQNSSRARLGLTSLPNTKYNLLFLLALHRSGLVSSVTRAGPQPPPPEALLTALPEPVTSRNVATRRLWVGLKYVDNEPVMRNVRSVSRPSRPVNLQLPGLRRVARGFESGYVDGLKMGECLFVATDQGILEVREALEKKVGGLVLARVSPY